MQNCLHLLGKGTIAVQSDSRKGRLVANDITRGVIRMMVDHGYQAMTEFTLSNDRRVDVIGLSSKGEIWIVEVKSCRTDYVSDSKWPEYTDYADCFSFAVAEDFPLELLPEEYGLIIADRFDADVIREAPRQKLAAARRKSVLQKLAYKALGRLNEGEL